MKHFKLLALALILVLSANVYSQWTFCAGSVNMTGLGTNPGCYTFDGQLAIVMGGVNGAPKIYKTTNGGANFTNITANVTGPELYCGCILDANTYLVGDGGTGSGNAKIWRTTDAGTTWVTVLTTGGAGGFFNGIVRASTNPAFIVAQSDGPNGLGSQCSMYSSTNAGANWTGVQQTGMGFTIGSLPAVFCIDNQFYGNGASGFNRVGWTANGGATWSGIAISVAGTFVSGAAFNDNKLNGLAITSGSYPNVSRTTNGPGGPWSNVSVGSGTSTLNILRWAPGTNICYLGTSAPSPNAIKQTTDNGATWSSMTTGGLTGFVDVSVQNNSGTINAYALAADGSVLKLQTLVAIDPSNTNIPSKFAMEQNYPNPFNPSTTIKYSVPVAGNVTVKVYNSLGIEIMTVVNKNHTAGNYVESVDMSGFSSGVYFYTLTAGDFKETRKMMLIK
jgi:photosystem II stability/assembly factor-like uncharacterized protein